MTFLLVAAGAAVGAPLRYIAAHLLDGGRGAFQDGLHWGTILVNVTGSFLLGLFSGLAVSGDTAALHLGVVGRSPSGCAEPEPEEAHSLSRYDGQGDRRRPLPGTQVVHVHREGGVGGQRAAQPRA